MISAAIKTAFLTTSMHFPLFSDTSIFNGGTGYFFSLLIYGFEKKSYGKQRSGYSPTGFSFSKTDKLISDCFSSKLIFHIQSNKSIYEIEMYNDQAHLPL
jgi:hypothetical protein